MKPILEIQQLSKRFERYHVGAPYLSLRDRLVGLFNTGFLKRSTREEFWALQDVSFTVNQGESLGIIGRNGAGKSTLLKILSRITPPTKGRVICRGRVASLLEVGTGFHQELTGRENVYMNGSILGMKKAEIDHHFDDIVDFSGVEKFLDTPLKHYSSGMQLRLAFSVAAHLKPEILIVDEVLAVGDSAFQKKCMSKMSEVAGSGRTILFVSHNMQAIRSLCDKALILKDGQLIDQGVTEEMISRYLSDDAQQIQTVYDLSKLERAKWKQGLIFTELMLDKNSYLPGDDVEMRIKLKSNGNRYGDLLFGITIYDTIGNCVMHLSNIFLHHINVTHNDNTVYRFKINRVNLKPGRYIINLFIRANEEIQDWLEYSAAIEIQEGNIYGFENSQMIQGLVQPQYTFDQLV